MNLSRIAILAPGLLGGSLALAIRQRHPHIALSIYARRDSAIHEMRSSGLQADYFTNPAQAVCNANLVIFCMTVGAMPNIAEQIKSSLKPNTIVTDVGSVKEFVDQEMQKVFGSHVRWIGSHPMAGGEKTGFSSAHSQLFENSTTIITPTQNSDLEAISTLKELWTSLGSRVVVYPPRKHDQLIAEISHLTHLTASALVNAVSEDSLEVRGPGFRDTTRVAAGSPSMWTEILMQNREPLLNSIELLQKELSEIQTNIQNSDSEKILKWLEKSSKIRSQL